MPHNILLTDGKCGNMNIKGEIIFTYKDKKDSELVYNSLEIDNEGFIESELNNEKIEYEIVSDKLGSFLATVDDLIASEIVVEKIVEKTKK